MVYHADNMVLASIQEIFRGPVNDVIVVENLRSTLKERYTLIVVKDRDCAKRLLAILQNSEKESAGKNPCLKMFAENEFLCFLFEYRPERKLERFAPGQLLNPFLQEKVCVNIVMECLSVALPYPLLYLILDQGNVQLEKDNSVYFTYTLDLSQLNEAKNEAACTDRCVDILLQLLQYNSRKRLKSFELLRKKADRKAYRMFPELYRDIRLSAIPEKKLPFTRRVKNFWLRNKDTFFRILLVLCTITVIVALLMLISQLVFGSIPFFRIFENSFGNIGTENLGG